MIEINNLDVSVEGKQILKGLNITLEKGKVYVIMGPNGSGKSTLANALMGHPNYEVTGGTATMEGEDLLALKPHERARKGLFLSFQYPKEVAGVSISNFLRTALNTRRESPINPMDFLELVRGKLDMLHMDHSFLRRPLNEGFSGGEKKKTEILQLLVLDPVFAILDETDSGLDIDAIKIVAEGINTFMTPDKCVLIITHHKRILDHVKPDKIFIMVDGKIVHEGTSALADHLEERGYGWIQDS